jgi:4-hydroxybenzoate polyprenyltransferase
MLWLQFAIGAANDWADAAVDTVAKPGKPIPAGLVRRSTAALLAVAAAIAGLLLAAIAGPAVLCLATAGLAVGIAYDLRLKATVWSWVPYAVGIPLLPVFAWVGATGTLPPAFAILVPIAMLAGAALAVANAIADLDRDARAGVDTVATALGLAAARRVGAALQAAVILAALGSALLLGGSAAWIVIGGCGAALAAGGVALGWRPGPGARQRAWEVQAIGLALLGAGWLGALAGAGRLAG